METKPKVGDRVKCEIYYHNLVPIGGTGTIRREQPDGNYRILWDNGEEYSYLSQRVGYEADSQVHFVVIPKKKPMVIIHE